MSFELVGVRLVVEDAPEYFKTIIRADKLVADFGQSAEKSLRQVDGASEIAIGALRRIGEIATNVFLEAGRAVVGFAQDSISVAGDFESGMNRFEAAAGDALTNAGIKADEFRQLFLQIGKELPVSTADVQEAAIELAKGGLDPLILKMGGLRDSIQFAAAAEMGLEEAATLAIKQLGVWTEATASAEEQTKFLAMSQDVLVRAAGASTLDVDRLAKAMNVAGGQARALNLDYRDFATGITLISPAFNSAEEAGTAYKNLLARLQPQTKPATLAMKELGLWTEQSGSAFFDAQGKYIGNAAAAEKLKLATTGLTDARKAELLQIIFGNDAMGAAVALAQSGAQGYDILSQKIEQAAGVSDTATAKQQGFNTAMDNFHGSVEALQITVGSVVLPLLTSLFNDILAPAVNTITTLTDALNGNADAYNNLSPALQGIVDTWTDTVQPALVDIWTWLSETIPQAIDFVSEHWDAFKGALIAIGAVLATGLGIATIASLIATLTNPITLVVAAVGLLGAAWAEDWGGIRTELTEFWETTGKPIFDEVVTWLAENIPVAIQATADFWTNTLQPALAIVGDFLVTAIFPALAMVVSWLAENIPAAVQTAANFWNEILWPALQVVWQFISQNIIPIFDALVNVYIALMKKELELLAAIWETVVQPAIEGVSNWLVEHVQPALKDVTTFLGDLGAKISTYLSPILEQFGRDVLGGIVKWFKDIKDGIKIVVDWLNDLAKKINSIQIPDWLQGHSPPPLAEWFGFIGLAVQNVARTALPMFQAALSATGSTSESVVSATEGITKAIDGLAQSGTILPGLTQSVANIANGMNQLITQSDLPDEAEDLGDAIIEGWAEGMDDAFGDLLDQVEGMSEELLEEMEDAWDVSSPSGVTEDLGNNIMLGLLGGLDGMVPDLLNSVQQITTALLLQIGDIDQQLQGKLTDAARSTLEAMRDDLEDQIDTIADTVGELPDLINEALADAYSSTADFLRQQSDALQEVFDLGRDPGDLGRLQEREAQLAEKGANIDAEIAERQQQLADIRAGRLLVNDEDRLKIEQELADLTKQRTDLSQQQAINQQDQADAARAQQQRLELQKRTQDAIAKVTAEAAAMDDPAKAAAFLKLRTDQILRLADLEQRRAAATSPEERALIDQQIVLEKKAQEADMKAFDLQKDQIGVMTDLVAALQTLNDNLTLPEGLPPEVAQFFQALTLLASQLGTLSGMADGGTMQAMQPYLVGERGPELVIPNANSTILSALDTRRALAPPTMGGSISNVYGGSTIVNVDARGSNLNEAQITQAVWSGISAASSNADVRVRMGVG